jgi:hypothetical protein
MAIETAGRSAGRHLVEISMLRAKSPKKESATWGRGAFRIY